MGTGALIRNPVLIRSILEQACAQREMLFLVTPYLRFESHFLLMEEEGFQGRFQTIRLASIAITCLLIVSYNEILQENCRKKLGVCCFLVVLAAVKLQWPSVGAGWNLVHNFL